MKYIMFYHRWENLGHVIVLNFKTSLQQLKVAQNFKRIAHLTFEQATPNLVYRLCVCFEKCLVKLPWCTGVTRIGYSPNEKLWYKEIHLQKDPANANK